MMVSSTNLVLLLLLLLFSSLLILICLTSHCSMVVAKPLSLKKKRCRDEELAALLQFKRGMVAPTDPCYDDPVAGTWREGDDCCSWDGVECDARTDHVISLDLSECCLYSFINSSSSLFTLTHLQRIDLSWTYYMDSSPHIPSAIGNLSSLTHLNLSNSNFVGEIPRELSNITTLVSLDLSSYGNNYLVMKLQSLEGLVRHMINLKELHLSFVNLPSSSSSSGVPHLLSNFSSLESLRLGGCELQADFPVAIFDLPKLKMLDISGNRDLKGYLPNFRLGSPLKSLLLSDTSFGGALPPSIGNLASMEQLEIYNCKFTGKLPMSLGNLTRIATFEEAMIWEGNHFSPDSLTKTSLSWIGKLTKLTGLDFRDMSLMGEIPSWLMNLTQLTYLYMDRNRLTGPVPSWLMSLPQLVRIDLSHNQLTGQLLSQFSHLIEELDVSYNNLEGSLPTNLSTLNNLYDLSLMSNRFVGSLELSLFSRLKSLYSLGLSYNNFSLSVKNISTENVVPFPNLTFLDLASCNVSEFPTFLHTNKNNTVFHLDLSGNSITGQISSWVFDLGQNLHGNGINLYLSHNLLTGFERQHPLFHPRGLIRTLDLRHNMLQGSLPIPPPPSIYTLESYLISNNYLSGEVSNLICSFRDIWLLDLSFNRFSGKLPQCLSNFSQSLSSLDLKGNKFEGNIPSAWGNGCQLQMISTSHNQLQGQLPRSLANCSSLEFVDFGNNKITDTFPSWLGTITSLSVLILRSNRLHGAIEDDLGSSDGFSNLRVFDLSNNNFRGNLPSKFINMANPMRAFNASRKMEYMTAYLHTSQEVNSFNYSMTMNVKGSDLNYPMIPDIFCALDFSANNFDGWIPGVFGDLAGLQVLNLSRNNLSGRIPSSFSNMKSLECLDLSRNQLSGHIPTELTKLTSLSSFDVSFNNLSGPIPQGNEFCTFESNPYEGNPGLSLKPSDKQCGNARSLPPLQHPPSPPDDGDDDDEDDSESEFKMKWMIISIGFVSGLVGGVIVGNELTTRKHYWFVKTFAKIQRWQAKISCVSKGKEK